ncbi:hypothetical protein [Kitasatospora sp. NPDC085464]|uniref:hypothetical protein n=1 Tax=Kitasatospora sp. NPDC085464 TaxID=3364063 RepID=UPI0037C927FA
MDPGQQRATAQRAGPRAGLQAEPEAGLRAEPAPEPAPEPEPEPGACPAAAPEEQPVELPEGSWWDWDVFSWRPGELRLAAGYDLSYHHGLELVFADPLYVRCPADFHDPVFRVPTPEERQAVERQCGEPPGVLVAFEADGGGSEPVTGLIAAGSLQMRVELVLRRTPGAESGGPAGHTPG